MRSTKIEDMAQLHVTEAELARRRKLSEIAAALSEDSTATLDPAFAADVQEFIDI